MKPRLLIALVFLPLLTLPESSGGMRRAEPHGPAECADEVSALRQAATATGIALVYLTQCRGTQYPYLLELALIAARAEAIESELSQVAASKEAAIEEKLACEELYLDEVNAAAKELKRLAGDSEADVDRMWQSCIQQGLTWSGAAACFPSWAETLGNLESIAAWARTWRTATDLLANCTAPFEALIAECNERDTELRTEKINLSQEWDETLTQMPDFSADQALYDRYVLAVVRAENALDACIRAASATPVGGPPKGPDLR